MFKRLRAPSPALVISVIALFVALGGTTYAATNLPANSVGTAQLKYNAVTAAKIANGAVVASKINTASLAWHEIGAPGEPAFENGWTNSGLFAPTAGYYKDPFGVVHLKGMINSGNVNTAAFTLPVGYRPAHGIREATVQTGNVAGPIHNGNVAGPLFIDSNGRVAPVFADAPLIIQVWLDGVTFRVDE